MPQPASPLHLAAGADDVDTVRSLLADGADPNVLQPDVGVAPLHTAAQAGAVAAATELLDAGAFLNLQAPTTGASPLMMAVWCRQPAMVELLLDQPRINPELVSTFGLTAEQIIGFGEASGDTVAQREDAHVRGLFAAYRQRRATTLEHQPLFRALAEGDASAAERAARVRSLLDASPDPNTTSPVSSSGSDGHTPLLVAARDGNSDAVEALLAVGADQTLTDEYMQAVPAHKAAFGGQPDVLRLLAAAPRFDEIIDAQGPVNGYTPLHDAVWHGHSDCARILVEAGARTDLIGYDGLSAADLARSHGYDECVEIIAASAGSAGSPRS